MKKSILIGALAVMMLFAFTACEPNSMTIKQESDTPSQAVMATLAEPDYYAGDKTLANTGKIVKATVTKEDGSTVEVMGTLVLSEVKAGENIADFTYGAGAGTTVKTIVNGIGVKAVQLDTSKVKTSYTQEEFEDLSVTADDASALAANAVVTYVWEDDTTSTTVTGVSTAYTLKALAAGETFDGTYTVVAKPEGANIVVTEPEVAEFEVTISNYEAPEAPKATSWILFVGDADDIPDVGKSVTASSAVKVEFGDARTVATNQIHVLGVTGTTGAYTLVEEIDPSAYKIYGLPAATFNEKNQTEPVASYSYEIQPVSYPGFAVSLTGSVTVEDPLNEGTFTAVWNKESAYKPVVGTTLPQATDFIVTATTLSGKDVKSSVNVAVVNPTKIYAEDVTHLINFDVTLTYGSVTKTVTVQCPTPVAEK